MTEILFFAGMEVVLNGDEDCLHFLQTQAVSMATIQEVMYGLELVFEDGYLVEAFEWEDGEKYPRKLSEQERGMPLPEVEAHPIDKLKVASSGSSFLGGRPPEGFCFPSLHQDIPFQYFGCLSPHDHVFGGLPFDLHLVAPLYRDFLPFFLDYSNPMSPVLLNEEELRQSEDCWGEEGRRIDAHYKKTYFQPKASRCYEYILGDPTEVGHTGVPLWHQAPDIPLCPATGAPMEFVCQLDEAEGVPVTFLNEVIEDEYAAPSFGHLTFQVSGSLLLFWSPQSQIACYLVQF